MEFRRLKGKRGPVSRLTEELLLGVYDEYEEYCSEKGLQAGGGAELPFRVRFRGLGAVFPVGFHAVFFADSGSKWGSKAS